MKEYLVKFAKDYSTAQDLMNELAKDGWKVVSTTFWNNVKVGLVVTFEREKSGEKEL